MTDQFQPASYWENRLGRCFSLEGVGQSTLGIYYNYWCYQIRRNAFLKLLRAQAVRCKGADCLDIGAGTGFYLRIWQELEAGKVVGCDLTELAVSKLREALPKCDLHVLDIGGDDLGPLQGTTFDCVSCMDVLFHITDDERYARALNNIYSLVRPGGTFILTDLFTHLTPIRREHVVYRALSVSERFLRAAGFVVEARRPLFVLMNEPFDSRSRILRAYWTVLEAIVARAHLLGWIMGAALYPLERALGSLVREGPSTEIVLCRRPL